MSGSIDASILSLYSAGASDAAGSILAILNGSGGTSAASSDPLPALQSAENNRASDIAATARQPQVARDLAAFSAAVASAASPAALLKNPAVLKVLLTVNGLGDQAAYPALASKALLSDPAQAGSLVNQLTDTNWKTAASTYQFATKGLSVLQQPAVLSSIANGYAEVVWRQSLDATTPGLSNAIDFRDRAATITSVDQILGDPTFRTVVTTALGIPEQIAFQDLGAQEQAIASKVDVSRFDDPKFVDTFTQRYLIAAQGNASASASGATLDSLAVQAAGLLV